MTGLLGSTKVASSRSDMALYVDVGIEAGGMVRCEVVSFDTPLGGTAGHKMPSDSSVFEFEDTASVNRLHCDDTVDVNAVWM
jgi:hypothetical protein